MPNGVVKIVEIQTKFDKAIQDMGKYRQELAEITDRQKMWNAQMKAGSITEKEWGENMSASAERAKVLKTNISQLSKQLQGEIGEYKRVAGSIGTLKKQYEMLDEELQHLSATERKTNFGKELQQRRDTAKAAWDNAQATMAKQAQTPLTGDYGKMASSLAGYQQTIKEVKAGQATLTEELNRGKLSQEQYDAAMAKSNRVLQEAKDNSQQLSKQMKNQMLQEKENAGSLRAMRAELSNLTQQYDRMSKSQRESVDGMKLRTQINAVTKVIKEAESETQRFYRNVGNYRSALDGLTKLEGGFKSMRNLLGSLGGALSMSAFGKKMVEVARNFEDSMARVHAVTNGTVTDMRIMRDEAMRLGATTKYTATEAADALEVLSRMGLKSTEATAALAPTLQLAQANSVGLADAATYSVNAMKAYQMQVSELSKINDIFSSTCSHSATDINQLAEAMKTAAPVAKTAGVPLEECAAALGTLANVGIRGSDAGTGIKQILLGVAKGEFFKRSAEALRTYGIQVDELSLKQEGLLATLKRFKEAGMGQSEVALMKVFGQYGAPRAMALINNIDQMAELTTTLYNSAGETERMFNQSLGKTSTAIKTLESTWENFMLTVYDSSEWAFVKPIEGLTAVIRFFKDNLTMVTANIAALFAAFNFAPVIKRFMAAMSNFAVTAVATATETTVKWKQLEYEQAEVSKEVAALKIEFEAEAARVRSQHMLNYTQKYIELEQELTLKTGEQTRLREALTKAGKDRELANEKAVNAQILIDNVRTARASGNAIKTLAATSKLAWATIKVAAQTAAASIKAAFASFAPLLAIEALIQVGTGLWRLYQNADSAENKIKELDAEISNTKATDSRIVAVRELKEKAEGVKHNTKEEKEILEEVNKLTGKNLDNIEQVPAALDAQITKLEKICEAEALRAELIKLQGENARIFSKRNVKLKKGETDYDGGNKLVRQFNDRNFFQKGWSRTWQFFGGHDLSSDIDTIQENNDAIEILKGRIKELGVDTKEGKVTPDGKYKNMDKYDPNKKGRQDYTSEFDNWKKREQERIKHKQKYEKEYLDIMEDSNAKQRKLIVLAYDQEVENLQFELDAYNYAVAKRDEARKKGDKKEEEAWEKKIVLNEEGLKNINKQMGMASAKLQAQLSRLDRKYLVEKLQRYEEEAQKELELYLEGTKENYEKRLEVSLAAEKAEAEQLKQARTVELDGETDQQKILDINTHYDKLETALTLKGEQDRLRIKEEYAQKQAELMQTALQTEIEKLRMAEDQRQLLEKQTWTKSVAGEQQYWQDLGYYIGEGEANILRKKYEAAQEDLAQQIALGQQSTETEEQYNARIAEKKKKLLDIEVECNDAATQSRSAAYSAYGDMLSSTQQLMEAFGEENKAMAKAAKVIALAKIAVDMGQAIADAVAANSGLGLAGIGTSIAQIAKITGLMASAISTVKSAKFAEGKVNINGAGTSTSDSIPAMISNGESVMNAKATKMFLPLLVAMNEIGKGVHLPNPRYNVASEHDQMEQMRDMFVTAVANVKPVVTVEEINNVQKRVNVIQTLDSI